MTTFFLLLLVGPDLLSSSEENIPQSSWPGMNRGNLSLRNYRLFNKATKERVFISSATVYVKNCTIWIYCLPLINSYTTAANVRPKLLLKCEVVSSEMKRGPEKRPSLIPRNWRLKGSEVTGAPRRRLSSSRSSLLIFRWNEETFYFIFFFEGLYFQENFIWKISILKTRTIKSLKEEEETELGDFDAFQKFSFITMYKYITKFRIYEWL